MRDAAGELARMITAGAFARVGDASVVAALLAPLPVLMVWGPFFWLAGWLWGTTGIELLTGQSGRSRRAGSCAMRVRACCTRSATAAERAATSRSSRRSTGSLT